MGRAYFGDIGVGETSEFKRVDLTLRYGVMYLTAEGYRVNAQTLNFGGKRYTYRVRVKDLKAGHLQVDIEPDD